jgi:hypothetical protein
MLVWLADVSVTNTVPLKEKCVEFICTDESWKAPHIASKLPALPIGKHSALAPPLPVRALNFVCVRACGQR